MSSCGEATLSDARPSSLPSAGELACRICGSRTVTLRKATERMFGTGEVFDYLLCAQCGCLQIAQVPRDLAPYYGPRYYSLQQSTADVAVTAAPWWRRWLRHRRNSMQLFGRPTPWRWLATWRRSSRVDLLREWYDGCPVHSLNARILDVGCGNGDRLRLMASIGFRNLVGIDPFLTGAVARSSGIDLRAADLESVHDGPYDVIMFHHSLEHMDEHLVVFRQVAKLLSPAGACLVRIPVASSELLEQYGDAWVEWDPPRHLYLHTPASLSRLVEQAGLRVVSTSFDSNVFCCWASELYRGNVSLVDEDTGRFRLPEDYFGADQMDAFCKRARDANRAGTASRAAFWIQHQSNR